MILTNEFVSEFVPSLHPSRKLMVILHGKGDSLRPFRKFNEEVNLPSLNYLILNAPKKYLNGYSWYGDPPYQDTAVPQIRWRLMRVIDDLIQQGWKAKDIFIFGFSQGCLVGADLVLHDHRDFAGFIGVSGYFHFYPGWRKQLQGRQYVTPWLLLHGKRDDVLPIENTKFGARKIQSLGISVKWIESGKSHSMDQEEADQIHDWLRRQRVR